MQPEKQPLVIRPLGFSSTSCGYCGGEKSQSTSDGDADSCACLYLRASTLPIEEYQILLDRGWRRSGNLLYKPDQTHSCCPHYSLRLPVADFKPRKDQRKACNAWNRFVLGEAYLKDAARLYPKSKAEKAKQRTEFDLVQTVHEAEYGELPTPPVPEHRFEVTLDPDDFTEEKYAVYLAYQIEVHHETAVKNSRHQFRRFLCNSPLEKLERNVKGKKQRLGSFHQCYRLDGRLIAFGVLDLLPHCVSGVYFVYHPDFERFSMGKVSALREAALALEYHYQYYYMGYYIHSCPKMQYKNDYQPQYFLDLESMGWLPLDRRARKLMDENHFVTGETVRKSLGNDEYMRNEKSDISPAEMERMNRFTPLFNLGFVGMMPLDEVKTIDLRLVGLRIGENDDDLVSCAAVISWNEDPGPGLKRLKTVISELLACVGTTVARNMVIDVHVPTTYD